MKILIVEDDLDSRDALALFLDGEGFDVVTTGNAPEALERLRHDRFAAVLTDHHLPGPSGSQLIADARREGCLHDARVLLFTASPDVRPPDGVALVRKPLDLDRLLQLLDVPDRAAARHRPAAPRVELALYVTPASSASTRALRQVQRALHRCDAKDVELHVIDLSADPEAGVEDRVAFTPTLVRRRPLPRLWFIGDLRQRGVVERLLHDAGVETRAS